MGVSGKLHALKIQDSYFFTHKNSQKCASLLPGSMFLLVNPTKKNTLCVLRIISDTDICFKAAKTPKTKPQKNSKNTIADSWIWLPKPWMLDVYLEPYHLWVPERRCEMADGKKDGRWWWRVFPQEKRVEKLEKRGKDTFPPSKLWGKSCWWIKLWFSQNNNQYCACQDSRNLVDD